MEFGEFILNGPASDIANNARVAASYLGLPHEGESAVRAQPSCPAQAGHPVIRGREISISDDGDHWIIRMRG